MTWPVYLSEAGRFKVIAEYKPSKQSNKFSVEVGEVTLSETSLSDKRRARDKYFIKQELGNVNLLEGNQVFKMHSDSIPDGDLMELRALHFIPLLKGHN